MTPQAHKAYRDATGEPLWGQPGREEKPTGPDYSRAVGGPSGQNVKSAEELRRQAELMVRGGRLGTVQKAMEALREDWGRKGILVR